MKKKKISKIIPIFSVLIILILSSIYAVAKHFSNNIEQMEISKLDETFTQVEKLLFKTNPYLTPDTAYFQKLEHLLYTGELPKDGEGSDGYTAVSTTMIQKNLFKGASFESDIYTVYTVLADKKAPYILVNGKVRSKRGMNDQEYMKTCSNMDTLCYADWRKINSSYLNNVGVFTIYRRYDSVNYITNEIISGYMIINYYRSHILNEINALISSEEAVILYNPAEDEIISAGKEHLNDKEIRKLFALDEKGDIVLGDGLIDSDQNVNLIYSINKSNYAPFYYVMIKEGVEVRQFMTEIYTSFLFIIIFFCVVIIMFILMYYRQYRKYLTGLVQVIKAVEKEEVSDGNAITTIVSQIKEPETDMNIIAKKIMDDKFDINELKKGLNSERRLRTEVEKLYGHVQINSHFLLNSLDTIYWESLKNHGMENDETKMIEMLCTILKYALDSSNPYISLEEEIVCAKNYIAIQQMRKNKKLEMEWIIPDELLSALVGKLTLQPILENSMQHGQYSIPEKPIRITIEARLIENILYLSISDNGEGMDEEEMLKMNQTFRKDTPVRSKHIGLLNVNRRIQLQYGEEFGIVLQPARGEDGLMVIIRLKYITVDDINQ